MYGYIKGIIKDIKPTHVIIENNNIGYLIIVANPYSYKLEELVTIYTYTHVREDVFSLYGFINNDFKEMFIKLISVSGIGPKTALSIMAVNNLDELIYAIEEGDIKYLTKFPGIGKKTASQIILDLKGKLVKEDNYVLSSDLEDAKSALIALGYNNREITKVLKNIDSNLKVEEIIKEALKKIVK